MIIRARFAFISVLCFITAVAHGVKAAGPTKNISTSGLEDRTRQFLETRIVGGSTASPGHYKYFVAWNGCGASLIHSDIILCAAHCNVIKQNKVNVGAYKFGSTDYGAVQRTITVRKVHPRYNSSTVQYDFLLMKLDSPVSQPPVVLNSNPQNPTSNELLTVIGMGLVSENGKTPTFLQQVNVNYVSPQNCSSLYKIQSNIMLCAGVPEGGKDSCDGDSGGPILDTHGKLVGIVSFGAGCAHKGYPGVYARVSGVIDWINQQICTLSSHPPSSCKSTLVTVRVDIQYDKRPQETSWTIAKYTQSPPHGGVIVATSHGVGVAGDAGKLKSSNMNLPKGKYVFNITDSGKNGICCIYGKGNYTIYENRSGKLSKLGGGNGKFRANELLIFSVA